MKKLLVSLALVLALYLPVEANNPTCKDGTIWTTVYGCNPPPAAPPATTDPEAEASEWNIALVWFGEFIVQLIP